MINRMKTHKFLSVWQTAMSIPSRPIFLLSVLCTSKGSREKAVFLRPGQPMEGGGGGGGGVEGRVTDLYQIG